MDIRELNKYAYTKESLSDIYSDISLVPEVFLMDWLKDTYDYQRLHSDEEIMELLDLTPEQILNWLEGAAIFVWNAKSQQRTQQQNSRGSALPNEV
jgi:hypothetical protein